MKNFDLDRLTACFAYLFAVLAADVHLQAHGQTEGAQAAPDLVGRRTPIRSATTG